ncbi:MAG: hypothetical protein ACKOB1_00435, partial [Planctomycetia bacterium]
MLQVVEQAPFPQAFCEEDARFHAVGFPDCEQGLVGIHFPDAFVEDHLRLRRGGKRAESGYNRIELRQRLHGGGINME